MSPKRLKTVLREMRERKDMSQLQLAKRAGVTQGYISDLEAGTKKNPSVAILKKDSPRPWRAGDGTAGVK
jgi:transcriptional regulator with XRE-family HTH domain